MNKVNKVAFFKVILVTIGVTLVWLLFSWWYKHPGYQRKLEFEQSPYAILTKDMDGNGWMDIALVSHGNNQVKVWRQLQKRTFTPGVKSDSVGFHPGFLFQWPNTATILLGAEGENEIRRLALGDEGELFLTGSVAEEKAVELQRFYWPGWGESIIVRPYLQDELVILSQFDHETLGYAKRQVVPLSSHRPSLMVPGRLTVLDADRDGIDEIYYGLGVARQIRRLEYPGQNKEVEHSALVAKLSTGHPQEVLSEDFNQDGYPDLLVPDSLPNGWLHIFMNDGTGKFNEVELTNLLPKQELQGFFMARDRDGRLLLLINATRQVHLLRFPERWVGDAGLIEVNTVDKPGEEASVIASLSDLDQDGWLDAVVGLDRPKESAWLCYGPLWKNFADLNRRGFILD